MKRLLLTDAYPARKLRAHPRNRYRRHDLDFLAQALSEGQHRTICVRASNPEKPLGGGQILAGRGVWLAATTRLGWDKVAATVIECDDDEALRIIVADNRASERGGIDSTALAELLGELEQVGTLLKAGYDMDAYEDVLANAGQVSVLPNEAFGGAYAETDAETAARAARAPEGDPNPARQIVLVFTTRNDHQKFQKLLARLHAKYQLGDGGATALVVEAVRREYEAIA